MKLVFINTFEMTRRRVRRAGRRRLTGIKRRIGSMPVYDAVRAGAAAARAVHGAYTAVRNVRRRIAARPKTEFSGGFTKCFKSKWRRRRRSYRARKFSRRVRNVIYSDVPRQTEIRDYTWNVSDTPDGATQTAPVKWFQFGLDTINDGSFSGKYTTSQLDVSATDHVTGILHKSAGTRNVQPVAISGYEGPCVYNAATQTGGVVSIPGTGGNFKFRKLYSSMKVTFKNPRSTAAVLELYTVRGIRATPYTSGNDARPATPLSAFCAGFASPANIGQTETKNLLSYSNSAVYQMGTQLMDSTFFRDNFKITKKCRVYIPAGGMLEKVLVHKRSRSYTTQYLNKYIFDRGTEYLVGKVYFEPMVGNYSEAVAIAGAPSGEPAPMLIGYAQYRMTLKAIEEADRCERQGYATVTVPVSTVITGNNVMTHLKL